MFEVPFLVSGEGGKELVESCLALLPAQLESLAGRVAGQSQH